MNDLVEEGRRVNEELRLAIENKVEDCHRAFSDSQHVENLNRRLRDENEDLKRKNEDLEIRFRHLQDKMNNQIYTRATEYKEQTLKVLSKGENRKSLSPTIERVHQQ